MSAFGGRADIIQGAPKSPLIAKSGHIPENKKSKIDCTEMEHANKDLFLALICGSPCVCRVLVSSNL